MFLPRKLCQEFSTTLVFSEYMGWIDEDVVGLQLTKDLECWEVSGSDAKAGLRCKAGFVFDVHRKI